MSRHDHNGPDMEHYLRHVKKGMAPAWKHGPPLDALYKLDESKKASRRRDPQATLNLLSSPMSVERRNEHNELLREISADRSRHFCPPRLAWRDTSRSMECIVDAACAATGDRALEYSSTQQSWADEVGVKPLALIRSVLATNGVGIASTLPDFSTFDDMIVNATRDGTTVYCLATYVVNGGRVGHAFCYIGCVRVLVDRRDACTFLLFFNIYHPPPPSHARTHAHCSRVLFSPFVLHTLQFLNSPTSKSRMGSSAQRRGRSCVVNSVWPILVAVSSYIGSRTQSSFARSNSMRR